MLRSASHRCFLRKQTLKKWTAPMSARMHACLDGLAKQISRTTPSVPAPLRVHRRTCLLTWPADLYMYQRSQQAGTVRTCTGQPSYRRTRSIICTCARKTWSDTADKNDPRTVQYYTISQCSDLYSPFKNESCSMCSHEIKVKT
jgi:hypothetical protein